MSTVRIKKLQRQIAQPLLVRDPQHLFYLTGHYLLDGGFLLITKKDAVLFGGFLEKVSTLPVDQLKNLSLYLKKQRVVAIEDSASLKEFNFLKSLLSGLEIRPVDSPVKLMRLRKDSDELAKMKRAYQITAQVFKEVKRVLPKKRWRENELADFIKITGHNFGADDISFPVIVASGPNAAVPHHVPTNRTIRSGETIVLDFGFKLDGYCSDFTRTVFLKEVSEKWREIYQATEAAYLKAVRKVRNGIAAEKVDQEARDKLAEQNLAEYFIHSLGHGTGLAVHEGPSLHQNSSDRLSTGMVFSIEPGVYLPGQGGVRIEDLVYLNNNKANYFVKVSTKLSDMIV